MYSTVYIWTLWLLPGVGCCDIPVDTYNLNDKNTCLATSGRSHFRDFVFSMFRYRALLYAKRPISGRVTVE